MGIRKADVEDWKQISLLLNQLDYPNTEHFIKEKIETFQALSGLSKGHCFEGLTSIESSED
ncbi:hypothetical protein [Virgibacillus sp. 6R]|uniref:hypothetical protein n=1 Tax=Metabacillus sp. 22489 TaxID=3453928 RepID=UPI0011A1CD59